MVLQSRSLETNVDPDVTVLKPVLPWCCATLRFALLIRQVAARVSSDEAEKDDWIVVKVLAYDPTTSR